MVSSGQSTGCSLQRQSKRSKSVLTYLLTHISSSIVCSSFLMSISSYRPSFTSCLPYRTSLFWYLKRMAQKLLSLGMSAMSCLWSLSYMPLKKQGRMRLQLYRSYRYIAGQRGRSRGSCPSSTPKILQMKLLKFSFQIRFPGESTSRSLQNNAIMLFDLLSAASCTSCRCLANCSQFSTSRSNPSVCTRQRCSLYSGQKWRSSISLRKRRCLAQTSRSSLWMLLNQQSSSSRYLQMDCPFSLTGTGLPPTVYVSQKQSQQLSLSARLLAICISLSMRLTLLFTKAISSSAGRLCSRYIIRYFSYCRSAALLPKNRNNKCRNQD